MSIGNSIKKPKTNNLLNKIFNLPIKGFKFLEITFASGNIGNIYLLNNEVKINVVTAMKIGFEIKSKI